jgi:hypothetical protein
VHSRIGWRIGEGSGLREGGRVKEGRRRENHQLTRHNQRRSERGGGFESHLSPSEGQDGRGKVAHLNPEDMERAVRCASHQERPFFTLPFNI